MTILGAVFYLISTFVVATTVLAITRRQTIHAVIYLTFSFVGSAMIFYLLGAPLIAALEVIIYAGSIMVLFLFVVVMLRSEPESWRRSLLRLWGPSLLLGVLFLSLTAAMVTLDPSSPMRLPAAVVSPSEFGRFLFERYWLAVEMISLVLFLALVAAIQVGRGPRPRSEGREASREETPGGDR